MGFRLASIFATFAILTMPALSQSVANFLGASTASLSNPHDLKLSPDGKYLFVSDVGNNRVAILDPNSLKLVSSFGSDHQSGTHDVDFDQQGKVYVADTHNNRVTIYRMSGIKATLVGELSERIRGPEGVLAHPNGRIYVAGAWSGNVVAYQDGKVVAELPDLSSPHDLELTSSGDIWLSEAGKNRMLLLTPDLKVKTIWQGSPFDFKGVRYQDVLPSGTVIAADKYTHSVKIISADGKLLAILGSGKPGKGPGLFKTPEGVEFENGFLWLSDSGNNRVVKYRVDLK